MSWVRDSLENILKFCSTLPCSSRNLNNTTICIIMPDLDQSEAARRDVDVGKQAREWQAKLEQDHGITNKHYSLVSVLLSK